MVQRLVRPEEAAASRSAWVRRGMAQRLFRAEEAAAFRSAGTGCSLRGGALDCGSISHGQFSFGDPNAKTG